MTDVLLVGGGHSHIEVLRRFGMRPVSGARLTLVSRSRTTPYSGMLPGLIAGHFTVDDAYIHLDTLARFAGARLIVDDVVGVDLRRRAVRCRSGADIAYELMSLDIGSTPNLDVAGAAARVIPVKPISDFLARWEALQHRVAAHEGRLRIAVVGGGAGGVELLLAVQHRLRTMLLHRRRQASHPEYHLFTPALLPAHNVRARRSLARVLTQRGVVVHTGSRVDAVTDRSVRTSDGTSHVADEVLWVTEAAAATWVAASGIAVDDSGFVRVDSMLRSLSHPEVFAAGDIASMAGRPLPKSGVVAVRQGPHLAHNLRSALTGATLRAYIPQRHHLSLISTGDRYAVASRGRWSVHGRWVWRAKEWIDRRFVRRYNDL